MEHTVKTEIGDIRFTLVRKRVKNINLRIHPDGKIIISAAKNVPISVINNFVISRAVSVERALLRIAAAPPPRLADAERLYILGKEVRLEISHGAKNTADLFENTLVITVRDTQNEKQIQNAYRTFTKQICMDIIPQMCKKLFSYFEQAGFEFPTVRYRYMRSCFGNCRAGQNVITFSTTLAQMPPECIEYVIVHELCHLVHQDHSARFYSLLCELVPDYKAKKKTLAQIPTL